MRISGCQPLDRVAPEIGPGRGRERAPGQSTCMLSELLWRYWKLALEVAYYGKEEGVRNGLRYRHARSRYDSDESWDVGRSIHVEVSKARRLIPSEEVRGELNDLRTTVVDCVDARLVRMRRFSDDGWGELHRFLYEDVRNKIDRVLERVAVELRLTSEKRWRRLTGWRGRGDRPTS